MWYNFFMDQRNKDNIEYLISQGHGEEDAERIVVYREKIKRRHRVSDEIMKRADQRSDELLLEIKKTKGDPSVDYAEFYEHDDYHFTRLGKSTSEGTDLFDDNLYPDPEKYELPEVLERKIVRLLVLHKLGAAINEDPPYSVEKDNLRRPKWEDGNKKVYYAELKLPHQNYSNMYLVRAVEEGEMGYENGENLVYARTERSLRKSLPLLFQAPVPARA